MNSYSPIITIFNEMVTWLHDKQVCQCDTKDYMWVNLLAQKSYMCFLFRTRYIIILVISNQTANIGIKAYKCSNYVLRN